jgi:hypothetical protein
MNVWCDWQNKMWFRTQLMHEMAALLLINLDRLLKTASIGKNAPPLMHLTSSKDVRIAYDRSWKPKAGKHWCRGIMQPLS